MVVLLQRMTGGKILCASMCTFMHVVIRIIGSQCSVIVLPLNIGMAMGCDVDGDIRLDFTQNGETDNQMREFRLVQVCLFGEWSYVCNWEFDYQDVDNNVLLQQLQCQNGG